MRPLLLFASALFFGGTAFADVILPIGNVGCSLQTVPFFGSTVLYDCSSDASASLTSAPPSPGLQGVSIGYTTPVVWSVAGTGAGGTQIVTPGATESQFNTLVLSTEGLTGGSGAVNIYMPLHYDFTIAPLAAFNCIATSPCTDPDIEWSLSLELTGSAVQGGELISNLISGSGAGHFTGDTVMPHSNNPFITVLPSNITAGSDVTVLAQLTLEAANFASDGSGSYTVLVPAGASFDFESAQSVPEPGPGTLVAGALLFLVPRFRTSRCRR